MPDKMAGYHHRLAICIGLQMKSIILVMLGSGPHQGVPMPVEMYSHGRHITIEREGFGVSKFILL